MVRKSTRPVSPSRSSRSAARKNQVSGPARAKVKRAAESAPVLASGKWTLQEGEVGIRVRMYRVGFGDFFLVSFLKEDGSPAHIVIDCGVFKGTSQTGDIDSIEAAVANMLEVTGKNVSLIIMTHRHADHIAGFARCANDFKSLNVQSVWMPIWESEYEPTAMKFQAELTRTALGLQQHLAAFGAHASEEQNTARKYMENALGVTAAAPRGTNADALALLKRGLAGAKVHYYQGGNEPELPDELEAAGLTAQILGPPPVSDIDLMKLMDLQKGVGQYLSADSSLDDSTRPPFGPEWEIVPFTTGPNIEIQDECYLPAALREWVLPKSPWRPVKLESAQQARPDMERALQQCQPIASLIAAKQLNAFLNNQSLVVFFTFRGKKLLFVGDAQAGNWEHWLFKTDRPDKKASGTMAMMARDILTSIDFYKVGHHGSGNATPIAAVEAMSIRGKRLAAMCSTQAGVYGTEDPEDPTKGTEVPRLPLLERLSSASALVRSDQIEVTVNNEKIAAELPAKLPAPQDGRRFERGALWIDCFL